MKKLFVFLLLIGSASVFASNLPVEHEAIRLMLAIESSVNQVNWPKAQVQLQALEALKLKHPEDFFYFNGLVNFQLDHLPLAEKNLEHYVVSAGKQGKYYIEALKLITLLDEQPVKPIPQTARPEPSTVISSDQRGGYIKSLQALYLTDDPVKALVLQINSLLSVHAYTGSRVKKTQARSGQVYSISVVNNQLSLQEKKYEGDFSSLTASKIDVHGLDPFLRYECTKRNFACEIYHPANTHLVWMMVDYDDLVARELVGALTKLIQHLQTR